MIGGIVGIGIVDALIDHDVDASNGVDQADQLLEVNFGIMRDADAGELGCLADGRCSAAVVVRGVELVRAIAIDIDHGVAGNGHERCLVGSRVDAHDDIRVGTCAAFVIALALIRADQHHVERLVEAGVNQLLVDALQLLGRFTARIQLAVHVVVPNGERGSASDKGDDQRAAHAKGDLLALGRLARTLRRILRVRTRILRRARLIAKRVVCARTLGAGSERRTVAGGHLGS